MFRINETETTWLLVKRHVEAEIEVLRRKLEAGSKQDPMEEAIRTATLRGEIKSLRALLVTVPKKDFSQTAG